jgi:transglutaminase-like putative cysteine protease
MKRRHFLLQLSAALPAATVLTMPERARALGAAQARLSPEWRTFEITTSVDIASPAGRTCVWLPVPSSGHTSYQVALDTHWDAPGATRAGLTTAPEYDVALLRVEWEDPKSAGHVVLTSRVATRNRRVDVTKPADAMQTHGTDAALRTYLRPTSLLPTDGIVMETAEKITRDCHGDMQKARAIYEWVVDNTSRDPKMPGCGMGDVASMLKSGYLGGKCADINALFVALARSVRIPARDAYGIRVADSRLGFKCLGRSGDISKAQHCRAEFYAPGVGWVPVDPADVRKVMLEEEPGGLPMSDPKVQAARAALFGSWEMNWIAYNHGHDVVLPGSGKEAIPFLMYPNGETAEGRLDSLSPGTFRYEIRVREVTS